MTPEFRAQARIAVFALPATLFMLVMFAVPLGSVFLQSITARSGTGFSMAAYVKIVETPLFARVAYTTIEISVGATFFALLLAYPIAYFLSRQPRRAGPCSRSSSSSRSGPAPWSRASHSRSSWDMPASSTTFWARSASVPSSCCTTASA